MKQKNNTILIIEDDASICKVLSISMESINYKAVVANNGKEGIKSAVSSHPDLILLDLQLPDMDGKEVITGIREWSQVPIIVCSCSNTDKEIIGALETGADDYITKPFNSEIVIARVHANLRKANYIEAGEPEIINGPIRMNLVRHEVYINGRKEAFTPKEYELLRYFITHRGKMLTHRDILKSVWGNAHTEDMQYLRVYVRQLREKTEPDLAKPRYIITEPGIGYRMEIMEDVSEVPMAVA